MNGIEWDKVKEEVSCYLQELIRIDTTNPPGNEIKAARYIEGVLAQEGFEPQVLEGAPGRGSVVARLKGSGERPPLILLSHIDVVPAEAEKWKYPPFSGALAEGYIWGRGALDCKNLTAAEMMVMLLANRLGLPLKRDLILAATAEEETGGKLGAGWVADNHPELVAGEYAINEGGGESLLIGGKTYYTCQVAEKGLLRFKMIARGRPGHASIPHQDNPVLHLARALDHLGRTPMPVHLIRTVAEMLHRIAESQGPEAREAIATFLARPEEGLDLGKLPAEEPIRLRLEAMLRNTATPTILQAGTKINVIPSEALARVDGRVLPGQEQEGVLAELRKSIGEGVEMEVEEFRPALEADFATPLYYTIEEVLKELEPEAILVPSMVTGGTDAGHLLRHGVKVYGFSPRRQEPGPAFMEMIHGHNERISPEGLLFATRMLFEVVRRFAS